VATYQALPRRFYERPTIPVALDLLGCVLRHKTRGGIVSGRIVEVEAYLGQGDPASHAFIGRTERTKIFWQGAGIAYIYFIYGMYLCFNVITRSGDDVGGVLVRALQPVEGYHLCKKIAARGNHCSDQRPRQADARPGYHPGRQRARRDARRLDYCPRRAPSCITVAGRVGISRAKEAPLRFYQSDSVYVSRAATEVRFAGNRAEAKAFLRRQPLDITP